MSSTSVTAPPSAPPDALALFASGTTELPAVFHEYLAAGGELAAINVLPLTEDNIKAAIPALTARDFTALSSLIDSTGQLSPEERAVLDDVPPGEGQLTAARAALTECLSAPNLTFIALATLRPSQLRAVALEALITPDQINEDLGKIDRILRLTVRIYKAVPFNVFNNRLVPKKRPAQDDGLSSSSKRLRGAQSQAVPPPGAADATATGSGNGVPDRGRLPPPAHTSSQRVQPAGQFEADLQALIDGARAGTAADRQETPPHPLQQQPQQQLLPPGQPQAQQLQSQQPPPQQGQQEIHQFFPAPSGNVPGADSSTTAMVLKQCVNLMKSLPSEFQQRPEFQSVIQSVSGAVSDASGPQPAQCESSTKLSRQLVQFASAINNPGSGSSAMSVGNPPSTASLQQLAVITEMNAASAKLSGMSPLTIAKLREALDAGVPPATLSKLFDDHVVHTDRGSSNTLDILRNAAAMTGLQGNSALALLKLPPVRPPSYFSGIKPSINQELLPSDKKNLLLVSMFCVDPSRT
jgi:hypothetical protein